MSGFYGGYPASANNVINLDYVLKEIKSFQEELDTVEERALAVAKEYTDAAIGESLQSFTARLLEFESRVNSELASMASANEQFRITITSRLEGFEDQINLSIEDFKNYVNTRVAGLEIRVNSLYSYVDIQNAELETRLKAYIANQVIDIKVVNYFTGEKVSVQEMLDYLASLHITNGLTYNQLVSDYSNVTYTMLDNYCANNSVDYSELVIEFKTIMDALQP